MRRFNRRLTEDRVQGRRYARRPADWGDDPMEPLSSELEAIHERSMNTGAEFESIRSIRDVLQDYKKERRAKLKRAKSDALTTTKKEISKTEPESRQSLGDAPPVPTSTDARDTEKLNFGSAKQIEVAAQDVHAWKQAFPEAAEAMKAVWKRHVLAIGHKRLARLLLDRPVKPYTGTKATDIRRQNTFSKNSIVSPKFKGVGHMRRHEIDEGVREALGGFPLRIGGPERSLCHNYPMWLVRSMPGGFVTANCSFCGKKEALLLEDFQQLGICVACPGCANPMAVGSARQVEMSGNYCFVCDGCDIYIHLADLLPAWMNVTWIATIRPQEHQVS